MTTHGKARIAGVFVGAMVMAVGLILSLEIGAWGRSLVAGTLTAVMTDRGGRLSTR